MKFWKNYGLYNIQKIDKGGIMSNKELLEIIGELYCQLKDSERISTFRMEKINELKKEKEISEKKYNELYSRYEDMERNTVEE